MKPIVVWQGTDKTVVVDHDFSDLTDATEIQVYIDSPKQIIKSLGDGVSAVTADSYLLTIAAADTESTPSGEYRMQAKITTDGGGTVFGRFNPQIVKVMDTVFTDVE